jgi:hypothetical protein
MSYADAIVHLQTDLETAAATLTPKMHVTAGEPSAFDPAAVIAYWYTGDRESTSGGNTLDRTNVEEGILIRCYWPATSVAEKVALELAVQAAKAAIVHQLMGAASLGSNAIGLKIDDADSVWMTFGDAENKAVVRTLSIQLWLDFADVDPIAL